MTSRTPRKIPEVGPGHRLAATADLLRAKAVRFHRRWNPSDVEAAKALMR